MALKNCQDNKPKQTEADIRVNETFENEQTTDKTYSKFLLDIFEFLKYIGIATIETLSKSLNFLKKFYTNRLARHINNIWQNSIKASALFFSKVFKAAWTGFKRPFCFFAEGCRVLGRAYKSQTGFGSSIKAVFTAFRKGCKNNKIIFSTVLNYSLPVIGIIAFGYLVNFVFGLTFAVGVEYNGTHVGYVQDEVVFDEAETKLQARMVYKESDDLLQIVPAFKIEVVPKTNLMSANELTDKMIMSSDNDIIEAEGITIDGVFLGAVKETGELDKLLEGMLQPARETSPDGTVKFAKDVVVEEGLFITQNIRELSELSELLSSSQDTDMYYQIVQNDAPITIAKKNNMSLNDLVELNPNILTKCMVGDNVLVSKSKPYLPVSVTKTETYNVSVPFEKKVTNSAQYTKGYTKITKAGVKGESTVTANVEYVDGVEVRRDVIETVVLKDPVTQQEILGTGYFSNQDIDYKGSYTGPVSTGKMVWPVTGGYISNSFRNYHRAIDIAKRGGARGAPIYATAAGKVIFAGWSGSYGKLIKIDHGNGLQTWYAHCDDISPVSVGANVSQGQVIAKVGSTGNSTGPHLHFEVRVNGVQQNPFNYLP